MNIPSLSRKERLILHLLIDNREMYGLEMVEAERELKRGTVYVTLGRMADKGFVASRQEETESGGPPRRLYKVTGVGERALAATEAAEMAARAAWAV